MYKSRRSETPLVVNWPTRPSRTPPPDAATDSTPADAAPARQQASFSVGRAATVAIVFGLLIAVSQANSLSGFALVEPGPTPEIVSKVTGEITDPSFGKGTGRLYMTTVQISEVTWAQWVKLQFSRQPGAHVVALGRSLDAATGVAEMGVAKSSAYGVAAAAIGAGRPPAKGVLVLQVSTGSPAYNAGLEAGDLITEVNGEKVEYSEDLTRTVEGAESGIVALVERGKEKIKIQMRNVGGTEKMGVMVTTQFATDSPLDAPIEGVAGGSGGLLLALAFADALDTGDLLAGMKISGTGTISIDGTVGSIVGVEEKVIGADKAGATVFFAPAANAPEAKRVAPPGVRVVPVTRFADAVKWLCDNGATSTLCSRIGKTELLTPFEDGTNTSAKPAPTSGTSTSATLSQEQETAPTSGSPSEGSARGDEDESAPKRMRS